jgi:hypothetical protein
MVFSEWLRGSWHRVVSWLSWNGRMGSSPLTFLRVSIWSVSRIPHWEEERKEEIMEEGIEKGRRTSLTNEQSKSKTLSQSFLGRSTKACDFFHFEVIRLLNRSIISEIIMIIVAICFEYDHDYRLVFRLFKWSPLSRSRHYGTGRLYSSIAQFLHTIPVVPLYIAFFIALKLLYVV